MTDLRFLGTARPFDNPRAVLVVFDRRPTDDELRRLHEVMAAVATAPAPQPARPRPSWLRTFLGGRHRPDA